MLGRHSVLTPRDHKKLEARLRRLNLLILDVKCRQLAFHEVLLDKLTGHRPDVYNEMIDGIYERWKELLEQYTEQMHEDIYA